jgi:hypothetical protein
MKRLLISGISAFCLAAQQPTQPPALSTINTYVRRIDADKALTIKRHIHTYGHANKPGADSLFWVFHTDFQGSSVVVYSSGSRIVKLVETARTDKSFTENSYYLKNGKLLFVKNRQVYCPILAQINAWRSNTLPRIKPADYFFRGAYYFAQDSCINEWERGTSHWEPDYNIPGGNGRWVTVPKIFPLQAARYLAIFDHPPKQH